MSDRRGSWTQQYAEVEYDVPLERDRMLPSHPSTPASSVSMPTVFAAPSSSASSTSPLTPSSTAHAATPQAAHGGAGHVGVPQSQSHPHLSSLPARMPRPHQPQFPQPVTLHDGPVPVGSDPGAYGNGGHTPRPPRSASFKSAFPSPLNPASPFGTLADANMNNHPPPSPNPNGTVPSSFQTPFGRPGSRASTNFSIGPIGQGGPYPATSTSGSRGSMILYRRADAPVPGSYSGTATPHHTGGTATPPMLPRESFHLPQLSLAGAEDTSSLLPPPPLAPFAGHGNVNRASVYSASGDSVGSAGSFGYDKGRYSSYGQAYGGSDRGGGVGYGGYGGERGLVAYVYDPDEEDDTSDDEDDWLHDPEVAYPGSKAAKAANANAGTTTASTSASSTASKSPPRHALPKSYRPPSSTLSLRGLVNITTLLALIAALLCLFVVYPVVRFFKDDGVNTRITGNTRINATGQAVEEGASGVDSLGLSDVTTTSTSARFRQTEINKGGIVTADGSVVARAGFSWNRRRGNEEWVVSLPLVASPAASVAYALPTSTSRPGPAPSSQGPSSIGAGSSSSPLSGTYELVYSVDREFETPICVTAPAAALAAEVGWEKGTETGSVWWADGVWHHSLSTEGKVLPKDLQDKDKDGDDNDDNHNDEDKDKKRQDKKKRKADKRKGKKERKAGKRKDKKDKKEKKREDKKHRKGKGDKHEEDQLVSLTVLHSDPSHSTGPALDDVLVRYVRYYTLAPEGLTLSALVSPSLSPSTSPRSSHARICDPSRAELLPLLLDLGQLNPPSDGEHVEEGRS